MPNSLHRARSVSPSSDRHAGRRTSRRVWTVKPGKTTLLNLIAGLDRPDSGKLVVAGVPISELGETDLARWRAIHVGFVFQFYNLLPVLKALENVEIVRSNFVPSPEKSAGNTRGPPSSLSALPAGFAIILGSYREASSSGSQ